MKDINESIASEKLEYVIVVNKTITSKWNMKIQRTLSKLKAAFNKRMKQNET